MASSILDVATINDRHSDKLTNVNKVNADVLLVQEAANVDVRAVLPATWSVFQLDENDKGGSIAKSNTAVAGRKARLKAIRSNYSLAVNRGTAAIYSRWIAWVDYSVDGGTIVRFASVHRPPSRYKFLWPAFDKAVASWVKSSPYPVILGIDANQRNPLALAKAANLTWVAPDALSIDGFLVSKGLEVSDVHRLPKMTSDHHPITMRVKIPQPRPVGTVTERVIANLERRGVDVLKRHEWGAQYEAVYQWRRKNKPAYQPADTVVQHITVTLDHGPLTGDFIKDVRTVEKIGYDRFRSGISYNWVVDMTTGQVAAGMPLDAKGTHTVNALGKAGYSYDQNYKARAIAVLGMPGNVLSPKAENSIVQILAAMAEENATTKDPDYLPHSFFAAKDCPCNPTRNRMGAIKTKFLALIR